MTEQFDIIQQFNLTTRLLSAASVVLLGLLLEFGLRFGRRWAAARNQALLGVVLRAFAWQPLLWGLVFGLQPLLQDFFKLVADPHNYIYYGAKELKYHKAYLFH